MTSFDDALRIILDSTRVLGTERVKLAKCRGRVLAVDIAAPTPLPPFDCSSKDGYAVCSTDLLSALSARPIELAVVGEATAGNPYDRTLETGQTVLITTGAKIPHGADAVVKQEDVQLISHAHVLFAQSIPQGSHVRPVGADLREAEKMLFAGDLLHAPEIGILGSLGISTVNVHRRPVVSILATGDELVELDEEPEDGQLYASSSHLLAALAAQEGARPHICGIAPDKKKKIRKLIEENIDCDLLLLTGGTSKGKHDFVGEVLKELGVDLKIHGVRIRPGRPMLFGVKGDTLVFGLPGNPLSTYITCLEFVRPALNKMVGKSTAPGLQLMAQLDEPYHKTDDRRDFFLGELLWDGDRWRVRRTGDGETQIPSAMVKSNCVVTVPEDRCAISAGDKVEVELLPGRPLRVTSNSVFRTDP